MIAELLQGFKTDKEYTTAKKIVDKLEYRDFAGKEITIITANNYRYLSKKRITVRKTIAVIIATFCIENEYQLIHNDKDFDPLEEHLGLKVRR